MTKGTDRVAPSTMNVHQSECARCGPSHFQQMWISKGGFDESSPCFVHRKCPVFTLVIFLLFSDAVTDFHWYLSLTHRVQVSPKKNAQLREKHKWAIEKPKLDNAWRLRGIYVIDPEDKEFKETIRNARKNGNISGSRHALQDMQEKQAWRDPKQDWWFQVWICVCPGSQWIHKNAYGRISTKISRGRYCRKRGQFTTPVQFGTTNLFLCLKQWRYPQQKQQWIENGEIGKDSGVGHNKSQK